MAPPLVQAIDSYAVEGCAPDLLEIDQAHRATRRLVAGFLLSQLLGRSEFDVLFSPSDAPPDPALAQLTVQG